MSAKHKVKSQLASKHLRRYWLFVVIGLLMAVLWVARMPVQAAPLYQTVPNPTPKPTNTAVPAATNTPKPDKNDNTDNNNNNQPTPTSASAQPVPTQPGGLTGVVTAASRLNLREGPGTNYTIIGTISSNEAVQILQRNEENTWWRVCCATGTTTEGWASAQFIKPNFDAAQANQLIPVSSTGAAAAPAPAAATAPTVTLTLSITQSPPFAWQGQTINLQFEVVNQSNAAATDVQVRDELPAQLTFIAADAGPAGKADQQAGNSGQTIVSLQWPQLAAGQTVTGTVQVQIAGDLPDGSVIDNLAVVTAANAAPVTAGISIGMPPTILPDFQ